MDGKRRNLALVMEPLFLSIDHGYKNICFSVRTQIHVPYNLDIEILGLDIEILGLRYNVELVNTGELLLNLLGKPIPNVDIGIMMEFWMIAGKAISRMYARSEVSKPKTGVG